MTWRRFKIGPTTTPLLNRRGRPTLTAQDPQVVLQLDSASVVYTLNAAAGAVPISGTAAQLRSSRRYALRISGEQDVPQVQTRSGRFPVTMLGWFYAVSSRSGSYMGLLSLEQGPGHSNEYNEVGIEGGAFNVYDHNAGLLASVGTASTATWYKVALVVTSGNFALYVGQQGTPGVTLLASGAMTNLPSSNDYQGIGGTQFTSTEWFDGRVANARIWNTNLSEAEIEAEFRSDTPVKAGVLGAWFRPDVAASNPLVADVGDNLIDGNGGGIPDYTVENGPTLDTTGYTLTADSGAVAIIGTAASLERGLKVSAASGSVPITGTAASLERGLLISASSGAVAIAGTAATLRKDSKVAAAFGNVPIAGSAASLERSILLSAASGSVPISGTAATLRKEIVLAAASANVPINGTANTFRRALRLDASAGNVSIAGTAAALERGLRVVASSGNVPINGTSATLNKTIVLVAAGGAVSISGTAASLKRSLRLASSSGAISVSGTDAQLRYAHRLSSASGTVPLSGTAATLTRQKRIAADFGTVSISGSAATLTRTRALVASPGAVPINGSPAELTYNDLADPFIEADAGVVPIAGSAAVLSVGRRLQATPGSVPIVGFDAVVGPLVIHFAVSGDLASLAAPRDATAEVVEQSASAVMQPPATAQFFEEGIHMSVWRVKTGDYHRRLTLDLTSITTVGASGVTFRIKKRGATSYVVNAAGTIDGPTRVSYQFVNPQLEEPGTYRVVAELQYVDGPETVPTEGTLTMVVEANL